MATQTTRELLAQADSLKSTDWKKSEALYKQILQDNGEPILIRHSFLVANAKAFCSSFYFFGCTKGC
jgi:hypothetical protein